MFRISRIYTKIIRSALHQVWRTIVLVVGMTVVLVGLALVVLPGPAFIVIPMGLAILALEFTWAKRLLQKARRGAMKVKRRIQPKNRD